MIHRIATDGDRAFVEVSPDEWQWTASSPDDVMADWGNVESMKGGLRRWLGGGLPSPTILRFRTEALPKLEILGSIEI